MKKSPKKIKIRIYNSLSQKIEDFIPQEENKIKMYVCGLTPYDYAHIGHARIAVFFDTLKRFLSYVGYDVKYVQNFTDVDDKIIKRANEEGKYFKEISEKYEKEYLKDIKLLNVLIPDIMPKVSEHIEEISNLISGLQQKGIAYTINDGIYFYVPMFKEYGKLSHQNLEELNKHRIEPNPNKKDIKDFALWKFPKEEDIKCGAVFESKCCGKGRPGWHIECSAMSIKYLGETLDIHGGGKDLIFPHHENEIAQSEAYTGKQFAKYWIHVHFVNIKGEKMSKSLKNFIRIKDALNMYEGSTLRLFLLSAHYRKDIDFNEEILGQIRNIDKEMRRNIGIMLYELKSINLPNKKENKDISKIKEKIAKIKENFLIYLREDMHTEKAIDEMKRLLEFFIITLQETYKKDKKINSEILENFYDTFNIMNNILGIYPQEIFNTTFPKEILELVKEREKARKEKRYDIADKIRKKINNKGYIVEDIYYHPVLYSKVLVEIK